MSVESRIKELIAEQLVVAESEISVDSKLIDDLGADSLDLIELLMILEEEYNLEIPDADAEKMLTVGDVVAYIKCLRPEETVVLFTLPQSTNGDMNEAN